MTCSHYCDDLLTLLRPVRASVRSCARLLIGISPIERRNEPRA